MTDLLVRTLGHPGLRKHCFDVNVQKIQHSSIEKICKQLLDCMAVYNTQSVSAPQIGYRYNMFAMEAVFYQDFHESKTEFESIFFAEPQNEQEMEVQTEALASYLDQMEHHLNHCVPYESDLAIVEKILNEQQQQNEHHSQHHRNQQPPEPERTLVQKTVIVINPQWVPLQLDEAIFEMEQSKGNLNLLEPSNSSVAHLSNMYQTLLFGCTPARNVSSNYEQCLSIPGLLCQKSRFNRIRVQFHNEFGEEKLCYLKSNDARLFQHECEHLHGRLMMDSNTQHNHEDQKQNEHILCVEEFMRRQSLTKPKIEELVGKLGVSEQQELYKFYDPLHPPIDEQLIEILEHILETKENQKNEMKEKIAEETII